MRECRILVRPAVAHFIPGALLATALACAAGTTVTRPDQPVQLTVIHDSGHAIPLAPYLSYLTAGSGQPGVLPDFQFPIRAPITAGVLTTEDIVVFEARWLTQPMFVLGADQASALWLRHNHERLSAMGAWGVVIAAPDKASFKALQQFSEGIPLAPSQGSWLGGRLAEAGVNAYPVLIGTDGRARQILSDDMSKDGGRP